MVSIVLFEISISTFLTCPLLLNLVAQVVLKIYGGPRWQISIRSTMKPAEISARYVLILYRDMGNYNTNHFCKWDEDLLIDEDHIHE